MLKTFKYIIIKKQNKLTSVLASRLKLGGKLGNKINEIIEPNWVSHFHRINVWT